MKVKQIEFVDSLEGIDPTNANVDIVVTTEEDFSLCLTCITPKNIEYLMGVEEQDYSQPGHPCIIVKQITKKTIEKAIEAYASDNQGYWLELYHFADNIDPVIFTRLKEEAIREEKESAELTELDNLLIEAKKLVESLEELIKSKEDD